MTALAASQGAQQLGDPQALTDGFSAAFLGAAGIALAGSLIAAVTLRQPRPPLAEPTTAAEAPTGEPAVLTQTHRRGELAGSPRRPPLPPPDKEEPMSDVSITATENGALSVKGPFRLVDADGNEYEIGERKRVALCRCGGSTTKPFCDGTHSRIGFEAAERAVAASEVGQA
jgi:CDGSH-type Zn-finger protein